MRNYRILVSEKPNRHIQNDCFDPTPLSEILELIDVDDKELALLNTLPESTMFKGTSHVPMMLGEDGIVNTNVQTFYALDNEEVDEALGRLFYEIDRRIETYWNTVYKGDLSEFQVGYNQIDIHEILEAS